MVGKNIISMVDSVNVQILFLDLPFCG